MIRYSTARLTPARLLLLALPLLSGCEQLMDRLHIENPEKIRAIGKAIGSACRHAGRGLEDCYRLNPEADKPAVFDGWKEMNEYMIKNKMESVKPTIPAPLPEAKPAAAAKPGKADETGHGAAKPPPAEAGHGTPSTTPTSTASSTASSTSATEPAKDAPAAH